MKEYHHPTAVTIANAIELTVGAVHELAPEVAKAADGSTLSRAALATLVASRFNARFASVRAKIKENKQ